MDESLTAYKQFIDGLVRRRNSVEARRVKEGIWIKHEEPSDEQAKYNQVIASLSSEQKDIISEILQQTRLAGIHDTLVFITDHQYQIFKDNMLIKYEPFGTEMYFDFISRCHGDTWPDERELKSPI